MCFRAKEFYQLDNGSYHCVCLVAHYSLKGFPNFSFLARFSCDYCPLLVFSNCHPLYVRFIVLVIRYTFTRPCDLALIGNFRQFHNKTAYYYGVLINC